jgi:hypothetical protein
MSGLIWNLIAVISYRFIRDAMNIEALATNCKRNYVSLLRLVYICHS